MSVERPSDWNPPTPHSGGENLHELFAQMLVNEVVAVICANARNFDLPITKGMDQLLSEANAALERLKASGQYFHQPNGSVFMDYKIMRGEANCKIGKDLGKAETEEANIAGYQFLKEQFNPKMSTEEALTLARDIVASWNWGQY